MGQIIRTITKDGGLVAVAIDSTDIAARAESIHQTSAVATAALGRLLTAASMMGSMLKGKEDSLTIRFKGNGPAGSLLAVADSRGNVKGTIQNNIVELPLNEKGKLDVAGAVGRDGFIAVSKDIGGREPYIGQSLIVSGEIAEDITHYFATSEQTPTVCALGVLVNPDLTVKASGGLLIQLLPFAEKKSIERLEKNIQNLPPVSSMICAGLTPQQICAKALDGFEFDVLDEAEVTYKCDCSRLRIETALITLPYDELISLGDESGNVEITCHFCDQIYLISAKELEQIANLAKK